MISTAEAARPAHELNVAQWFNSDAPLTLASLRAARDAAGQTGARAIRRG